MTGIEDDAGGPPAVVRAYRTPSGGMEVESLQITASGPGDPGAARDVVRRLATGSGGGAR